MDTLVTSKGNHGKISRRLHSIDRLGGAGRDHCDPFDGWRSIRNDSAARSCSVSRRYGVAFLWALAMIGGLWIVLTRVDVHSELADLLPEGTTATQRLLLTQVRSGLAGRVMLLALDGGNPDQLAEASRQLSERLRTSGYFTLVENGGQGMKAEDRAIVFQARYLLSPRVGRDAFSKESLREALEQRLDDLRSPFASLIKETIPA